MKYKIAFLYISGLTVRANKTENTHRIFPHIVVKQ